MQASAFQSGLRSSEWQGGGKLGDNFCSQDALQMIRNQLDDDSSDEE
jgi:hypothetical protein